MQQHAKPIKRSKELVPLSKDHHDGLLLCWKINYGISNNVDVERILKYVLFFYEQELKPHFAQEEEYVFSLLPDNDPMKIEAFAQHDLLNGLYARLKNDTADMPGVLSSFANELNRHIRYEERQLFPYIERIADRASFEKAGIIIAGIHEEHACAVWDDEFWTRKK